MKLLVWLALGVLVYWALRTNLRVYFRNTTGEVRNAQANTSTKPAAPRQIESMVACAYCQIYVPVSEAIHLTTNAQASSSKQYFCCEEHIKMYVNTTKNSSETSSE